MKLINRRFLATFAICLTIPAAHAAEYDDADILPRVTKIEFGEKYIGLVVQGIGELEEPAFILDRASKQFRQATVAEFDSIFGLATQNLRYGWKEQQEPRVTSNGTLYTPVRCEIYEGEVLRKIEMTIDGQLFNFDSEHCSDVSEIEIVDDVVWIGTYLAGDHGFYGLEGLVAVRREDGSEIGRVDTGNYPIHHVRVDPFSGNLWAITTDKVVVVQRDLEIESTYVFYYDFDDETKMPVAWIANEPTLSHPLAVFARSLPENRHAEFFDAVQTIPDEIARSFSLYNTYMCCHFLRDGDVSSEPQEFQILIPFLLSGFEKDLPRYEYNGKTNSAYATRAWRQIACKHRNWNEEAENLCVTEDWFYLLDDDS